jgi:hypothetical protein
MKQLIFVGLFLTLFSCKKETELNALNDSIQGTWEVKSNAMEYFNTNNQRIYVETLSGDGSFKEVTFSEDLTAKVIVFNDESYHSKFDLLNVDRQKLIRFYDVNLFNAPHFEIVEVAGSRMVWKVQYSDIEYVDAESSETIEAAYAYLTVELTKK